MFKYTANAPAPAPRAQALPDELGRLSRLRMLRVRRNRLAALPAALAACSALVELHAGFNAIAALPEGLGALRGLAVLELRNNLLTVSWGWVGWLSGGGCTGCCVCMCRFVGWCVS